MKPIVHIPSPVLTIPSKTVTVFDKKLAILIKEMKVTLRATRNPKGVGLAAPQIGEGWRVFVTRPKEKDAIRVFVNPSIVSQSPEQTDGVPDRDNKLEGCLSIPGLWGTVHRSTSLTLSYQDEQGNPHTEQFEGFLATIIQHETDHTNGILYTQRVIEQQGKMYQIGHNAKGEEVLDEIILK